MIKILGYIFLSILVLQMISCRQNDAEALMSEVDMKVDVPDTLLQAKIYFGHMSVGFNILSGVEMLREENSKLEKLNIVETDDGAAMTASGLYHSRIGKNGFPYVKTDNFKEILMKDSTGNHIDVALFKFCYVDFNKETDVDKLFDYYTETMESLQNTYPDLKIVPVTVPLLVHSWGLKGFIKNIIRKDMANIRRNEFNQRLREVYKDRPVYDLAAVESTYPDGSRETFTTDGKEYFALIKGYTYDGGHLNEPGKVRAAQKLLTVLSGILE